MQKESLEELMSYIKRQTGKDKKEGFNEEKLLRQWRNV